MLIDTHAHLDFPEFAHDLDEVVFRAQEAGVEAIISIGTTLASSRNAIKFAEKYPAVYAVVGVHPNSIENEQADFSSELRELTKHPKVAGIGETGLDYHYLDESESLRFAQAKAAQSAAFIQHLELAVTTGKSVVIHQRDAWSDTLEILGRYTGRLRAVMHCFGAGPARAGEVVELGHLVSFTGIVTFKNASEIRAAAASIPIDRIMVETDAPYLAPVPHRGKRCEPADVGHTAAFIAKLRGLSAESFGAQTTHNARRFFGIS